MLVWCPRGLNGTELWNQLCLLAGQRLTSSSTRDTHNKSPSCSTATITSNGAMCQAASRGSGWKLRGENIWISPSSNGDRCSSQGPSHRGGPAKHRPSVAPSTLHVTFLGTAQVSHGSFSREAFRSETRRNWGTCAWVVLSPSVFAPTFLFPCVFDSFVRCPGT